MFVLDNLIPKPLHSDTIQSDIWLQKVRFEYSKNYFIEAPSGSGKTTFQHVLYGLRKDYEGGVYWQKEQQLEDVSNFSVLQWSELRKQYLSVVFQDLRLFLDLTTLENIQLKNALTNHKSMEQIEAMCTFLDIVPCLNKKCAQLSYGQRQRVAIVRALCQPFKMIILDEPFAHLDTANIKKCCTLIQQECNLQGAGLMMVSLEEPYFLNYDISLKL